MWATHQTWTGQKGELELISSPTPRQLAFWPRVLGLFCLVAIGCYCADRVVYVLGIPPTGAASFWPATPLLVAVLLFTPRKIWPVLLLAGLGALVLADFKNGVSLRAEVWITLGNLVDALIAALGLQFVFKGVPHLTSVNRLIGYIAIAVILAPTVSACVGANCAPPGSYWLQWRLWFFADALGFLTITPAILSWVQDGRSWARKIGNWLELGALSLLLLLLGYLAFMDVGRNSAPALLYSLAGLLLWAALRLGVKGVSTAMIAIALLASGGATIDRGPFTGHGALNNALSLQLFLLFAALPVMALAVVVEEEKQDNARRKLAEETLRESEERFRNVFRDAGVGMIIVSPQGRFLAANDAFCEYLGYSEDELRQMTVEMVTQPEDWAPFSAKLSKALTTGASFRRFEKRCRHKSGRTVYTESSASLIRTPNGEPKYFVGEVLDVTKRKMAEDSLAVANRGLMEAQEKERVRIARDLHDDVNQRIALLAMDLDQLAQDAAGSPANFKDRLAELLRQTREISSDIQSLSHQLHPSKIEYLGIVAAIGGFCREFGARRGLKIRFVHDEIPAGVPRDVSVCLFRVLQEALHNAAKHSGAQQFDVQLYRTVDGIGLRVSDSGVGFDPEAAAAHSGLGLISMRERLRLIEGTLAIRTKPNEGTTVDAFVPAIHPGESKDADASRELRMHHNT